MTEKKFHPEDNIEVPSFKSFVINAFRLFFKLVDILILSLRKGTILLIGGAVAGALVGEVLHLMNKKNFSVAMVVEYTNLDKRTFNDVIEQLGNLVRTSSDEVIAANLKVSQLVSQNINSIAGKTLDGRPLSSDTSSYPFFRIEVGLKSPYGADSLETGLINYFNELPYLKKSKEAQIKVYSDELANADRQAVGIDSLKSAYVHSLNGIKPGSGISISEADPANLFRQAYQLDTMRASLRYWLDSKSQSVVLVRGFQATRSPQSLSAPASIVLCVTLGVLIALIFSMLRQINLKINGA
jgi:hypothetical protein